MVFILSPQATNVDGVQNTHWYFAPSPSHLGPRQPRYTNIIFDLGDVLFTYSTSASKSPLPSRTLKHILRCSIWLEYEKGNLTEQQTYARVAQEYKLSFNDVADAFKIARASLKINLALLDTIKDLQASGLRIFIMSNMSSPDWEVVSAKLDHSQWSLFERIFISGGARECKPHIGFYQHVLQETGIDPARTIFVDDKVENVVSARSLGMSGLIFDNNENVTRRLRELCRDPILPAKSFLAANKQNFVTKTSTGVHLDENYTQLLIQEATGDSSLVHYAMCPQQLSNFFRNSIPESLMSSMFWREQFPGDLDTAAIALTVADVDSSQKHRIMDEMLSFCDKDGLVQVYFDHNRPRLDPVVCINVLTLFYRNGRGRELDVSLDWVYSCLLHRAYIEGTLYYATAETFFFFLSRLMKSSTEVRRRFEPIYRDRLMERFGVPGNSLAIAMRILAAASVDMVNRSDVDKLLAMQQEDGSWVGGWFYRFGSSGMLVGNDGLSTALAIKAIEAARSLQTC
ncbi:HAD-like protein [Ramaria rubella]|nr:HAD-like protein [Ramaria rubella]